MTVPKENISNTVLLRALPIAPVNQTWPMLLNTKDGNINDQVELWKKAGTSVEVVDPAGGNGYTIEIQNPNYWEFVINWTGAQPVGDTLYVFRRTRGVVEAFTVGAFLSAEALNQRFDLDNLGINDTAYYQSKTNPMYSKQAIATKGIPDTTSVPHKNPSLPAKDLQLPYLGTGSPAFNDVYTWGKKITNSPNPGDGEFQQVLIGSASGGGTVAQLVAELANDTSAGTAGGNMIGLWSPPNPNLTPPAGGWPGSGQTLESWFLKMSVTTPDSATGGTQVGINITGTGNWNIYHTPGPGRETSVQAYCDAFHFLGSNANLHYGSGASWVGYSGWALNTLITAPDGKSYNANSVAGCLNRLNKPATSPTASGSVYVKWWSPNALGSQTVQEGLERLSDTLYLSATISAANLSILVGILPGVLVTNPSWIRKIVYSVKNINSPSNLTNAVWTREIDSITIPNTAILFPCYSGTGLTPWSMTFEISAVGHITATKPAALPAGNTQEVKATIYLNPDR